MVLNKINKRKANSKKNLGETKKIVISATDTSPEMDTAKVLESAQAKVESKKRESSNVVEPVKTGDASGTEGTVKKRKSLKSEKTGKKAGKAKASTKETTEKNNNITKVEKLRQYLQKKKMDMFEIEEIEDDNKTAVFRTRMEVGNTLLPMAILLDNSVYVLIQVELLPEFIKNDEQFDNFVKSLNALNNAIRPFKFAISGKGDFMLNMILTSPNSQFDPALCHAFVVEIIKYLDKDYKDLVNACLEVRDK